MVPYATFHLLKIVILSKWFKVQVSMGKAGSKVSMSEDCYVGEHGWQVLYLQKVEFTDEHSMFNDCYLKI